MMAEVYIRWPGDLDALAERLRHELNLPERNTEKREGINWGGEYWVFVTLGFTLRIVHNRDDTLSEERSDYPFYLAIEGINRDTCIALAAHLEACLRKAGLDVVADSLLV